jgi:hypothetical protein
VPDLLPKDGAGEHRVVATLLRQVNFNGQFVLGVPHTRNLELIMLRKLEYIKKIFLEINETGAPHRRKR